MLLSVGGAVCIAARRRGTGLVCTACARRDFISVVEDSTSFLLTEQPEDEIEDRLSKRWGHPPSPASGREVSLIRLGTGSLLCGEFNKISENQSDEDHLGNVTVAVMGFDQRWSHRTPSRDADAFRV